MTDIFLQSIRFLGSFSESEIETIRGRLKPTFYKKGELLLDRGETCNCFWFLEEGSVYSSYLNQALDPVTTGLYVAGDWIVEQSSFTARLPSKNKIEAFTDTKAHILTIHELHHLIEASQKFFQLGKILGNGDNEVLQKDLGPDERYLQLMAHKPALIQHFPLKYIASYLGMTPETLSRVRKRISGIS